MKNISLIAIILGALSYFLPFILLLSLILIKLTGFTFSALIGLPSEELDLTHYPYEIAHIIISIFSGYISMKVSIKESYINPATVGIIIVTFYTWLSFFNENTPWSVTDIAITLLTIPATLFGGYLALRRVKITTG